jgi:Holliday junction resolvase RusA-like endonuclease
MTDRTTGRTLVTSGTIPLAPSVNGNYAGKGKRYASPALKAYKKAAGIALARHSNEYSQRPLSPGVYELELRCYFPTLQSIQASDADGRIKAAQDCIMTALGVNDNRIYRIISEKSGTDGQGRIEWTLTELHGDRLEQGLRSAPDAEIEF